ncbi:hypothetical protein C0J52_25172 [Blattella germanica]|nr:hypothetical protein C0J52_25172 [Blattella germanica]
MLFDNAMLSLWPDGIKYENVLFFVTDDAPYMIMVAFLAVNLGSFGLIPDSSKTFFVEIDLGRLNVCLWALNPHNIQYLGRCICLFDVSLCNLVMDHSSTYSSAPLWKEFLVKHRIEEGDEMNMELNIPNFAYSAYETQNEGMIEGISQHSLCGALRGCLHFLRPHGVRYNTKVSVTAVVQTSGFHTDVEFNKTSYCIAICTPVFYQSSSLIEIAYLLMAMSSVSSANYATKSMLTCARSPLSGQQPDDTHTGVRVFEVTQLKEEPVYAPLSNNFPVKVYYLVFKRFRETSTLRKLPVTTQDFQSRRFPTRLVINTHNKDLDEDEQEKAAEKVAGEEEEEVAGKKRKRVNISKVFIYLDLSSELNSSNLSTSICDVLLMNLAPDDLLMNKISRGELLLNFNKFFIYGLRGRKFDNDDDLKDDVIDLGKGPEHFLKDICTQSVNAKSRNDISMCDGNIVLLLKAYTVCVERRRLSGSVVGGRGLTLGRCNIFLSPSVQRGAFRSFPVYQGREMTQVDPDERVGGKLDAFHRGGNRASSLFLRVQEIWNTWTVLIYSYKSQAVIAHLESNSSLARSRILVCNSVSDKTL